MAKGSGDAEIPSSVAWAILLTLILAAIYLWWWRPHHIDNGRIPPVQVTPTATPSR